MLFIFLGFVALAAYCVRRHLASRGKRSPAASNKAASSSSAKGRAVVLVEQCVGCATCVPACPEAGAIVMVEQLAVVDRDICIGHGDCVAACPVGAVQLSEGDEAYVVEVPDVDENLQSNVKGLYIAGELGGRGLITNAVNEGKLAAEHIARELASERNRAGDDPELLDVIIVGSGPAGLSAGLEALRSNLRSVILEQGELADTIRKYPRDKLLLAGPLSLPVYGDLWVGDASKESLLWTWESIISSTGVNLKTEHGVERISKNGEEFHVLAAGRTFRTRRVILAIGRRGTPRRLDVPGEDLAKALYDVTEMEVFSSKRVLVVGGGDSAIETALGLANQQATTVSLSYRGAQFGRVQTRLREKLEAAVKAGRVDLLLESQVREIGETSVTLDGKNGPFSLPNDYAIIRIGGNPSSAFLEQTGVRIVRKEKVVAEPETVGVG
jgi:thioredoxin reductase (NADPH)